MNYRSAIKFLIMVAFLCASAGCDSGNEALSLDQLIAKSRQAYVDGKVDNAIKLYKQAIKRSPNSSDLHYELGFLYHEEWRKSHEAAQFKLLQEYLARGAKKDYQADEKLLIDNGYKKEYYDLAFAEFTEAVRLDPSNWRARYYIAIDLFNDKKYEQAIVELKEVVKLRPDYSSGYTLLGEAYLNIGKYQLAVDTLEKARDLHPVANHYYILGQAYKKMNNRKKVDEMVNILKEMKSDFADRLRG